VPCGLNRSTWKTTFLPLPQTNYKVNSSGTTNNQTNSSSLHLLVSTNESIPNTKPSIIPYQTNGPIDPNLWDSNFFPISLLGVDKFLNSDAKKIAYCQVGRG